MMLKKIDRVFAGGYWKVHTKNTECTELNHKKYRLELLKSEKTSKTEVLQTPSATEVNLLTGGRVVRGFEYLKKIELLTIIEFIKFLNL